MPEEKEIEEKKERAKKWLKNPYNLAILAIILIAVIIRLYYFSYTSGQTMWHDEAEYVSMAKNYESGLPYMLSPKRPFMFSGIIALFFIAGLSEQIIRFFMVVLPSIALVLLIYLLGKEMYNKKVALIASLLAAVSWTLVFWTERMQPDLFSMCFQVLAILFMWKFFKEEKNKHVVYSGIFASLGFTFKVSGLLVPVVFLVFILLKDRLSAFRKKGYYLFLLAFIIFQIPQAIYSQIEFGTPLAIFGTDYLTVVTDASQPVTWAVAMQNIQYYRLFTENILFLLFLLGAIISLEFILYLDVLVKDKTKFLDAGLFAIILFILTSAYYIFWIKGTDDRWVFIWLPFLFFLIARASVFVYSSVKKYGKILAVLVVLALLAYGVYSQFNHADSLIKNKKDTYTQVKAAAIWMEENSNPGDIVLSASYPQTTYYSERKVIFYMPPTNKEAVANVTNLEKILTEKKPKFLTVSVFEAHPQWLLDWVQQNQARLNPVQAYFADAAQTQLLLVVYEIKY